MSARVEGVDLTPQHLLVRGDHLPDYSRVGQHADALEAALVGVSEAEEKARADRNLTAQGVTEKRAAAASAALTVVQAKTDALLGALEKEEQAAGGNPFVLTHVPDLEPSEAAAQRRHVLDLFLDNLKAQPDHMRDVWLEAQLMRAAAEDRKLLLGAIYEAAGALGPGAYGLTPELLEQVQEAHFRSVAPEKVDLRDSKRAAAQLARTNAASAERRLREWGAGSPEPALL